MAAPSEDLMVSPIRIATRLYFSLRKDLGVVPLKPRPSRTTKRGAKRLSVAHSASCCAFGKAVKTSSSRPCVVAVASRPSPATKMPRRAPFSEVINSLITPLSLSQSSVNVFVLSTPKTITFVPSGTSL